MSLLGDPEWLIDKGARTSLADVLADYEFVRDSHLCRTIAGALRMCASLINHDISQVPSQLVARLVHSSDEDVRGFLARLYRFSKRSWLVPLSGDLRTYGSPLTQTLVGHKDQVRRLLLLDADHLLSASGTGELIKWRLRDGVVIGRWATLAEPVSQLLRLGESTVLLATHHHTVFIFDLTSGRIVAKWKSRHVEKVSFDPESKRFAFMDEEIGLVVVDGLTATIVKTSQALPTIGSPQFVDSHLLAVIQGNDIRLVDLRDSGHIRVLSGHRDRVRSLSALDRDLMVSASDDMTVRGWRMAEARESFCYSGHKRKVEHVEVLGNRFIASMDENGSTHLLSRTGRLEVILENRYRREHESRPELQLLGNGSLTTTDTKGFITIWSLGSGTPLDRLLAHHWGIWHAVPLGHSKLLTSSSDKTIRLWDLATETMARKQKPVDPVHALSTIQKGLVVAAHASGKIGLFELRSGRQRIEWSTGGIVRAVDLTLDGHKVITAGDDGILRTWNAQSGALESESSSDGVGRVALKCLDSRLCAVSSRDGSITIFDVVTGAPIQSHNLHKSFVYSLSVTASGLVLSGDENGIICITNAKERASTRRFAGHSGAITGVSGAGKGLCVSVSLDGTARVWNLRTGSCEQVIKCHRTWVEALALTPQGFAVSGDKDGNVYRWNIATGAVVGHRTIRGGGVVDLAGSENGLVVIVGSEGRLTLWDTQDGSESVEYTAEEQLGLSRVSPRGARIVVGDRSGQVHILRYLSAVTSQGKLIPTTECYSDR
jgi:WD40 repeat protein